MATGDFQLWKPENPPTPAVQKKKSPLSKASLSHAQCPSQPAWHEPGAFSSSHSPSRIFSIPGCRELNGWTFLYPEIFGRGNMSTDFNSASSSKIFRIDQYMKHPNQIQSFICTQELCESSVKKVESIAFVQLPSPKPTIL